MRDPELQKKAVDYTLKKASPITYKVGSGAINQFSTKARPNYKYKTDRMDLDSDMYKGEIKIFQKCTQRNYIAPKGFMTQ